MTRKLVGIVDYGAGNIASVTRSLKKTGYRCFASRNPAELDKASVLVLPGVGAFPSAMQALHGCGLVGYLQESVQGGRSLVGICLGMQLLGDFSEEIAPTAGLGFVPGRVVRIRDARWHIGWNALETSGRASFLAESDGRSVYFNHSYVLETSPEYVVAVARLGEALAPFPVAVQRGNIFGLQFHPEKSQSAGLRILSDVLAEAHHAG
ncbi:imidazole glycerol phosphate synthase subunit HisH [Salinarimonas rosea]|uniref:imidazole glycerol phosphate synthase subunit HisH n=1 Tax=Salinarimonas rosea TaxID=552063 RepID=UPI00041B266C|nr:imidazole glycerol phosphate synthase subunit HisH [Salinarimonas rosea]